MNLIFTLLFVLISYNTVGEENDLTSQFANLFNINDKSLIHLNYKKHEQNRKFYQELLKELKELKYLKAPLAKEIDIDIDGMLESGLTFNENDTVYYRFPADKSVKNALFYFSKSPSQEPALSQYIKDQIENRKSLLTSFISSDSVNPHLAMIDGICDISSRDIKSLNEKEITAAIKENLGKELGISPDKISYGLSSKPDGLFSMLNIAAFSTPGDNIFFTSQSQGLGPTIRTHVWFKKGDRIIPVNQVVYNSDCQPSRIIKFEHDGLRIVKRTSINFRSGEIIERDFQPEYYNKCHDPTGVANSIDNMKKIIVAVIDGGFEYTLPQFNGRLMIGWDFEENDPFPFTTFDPLKDDLGLDHGTAVASIYLQNKEARILPLKISVSNKLSVENLSYGKEALAGLESAIDFAILKGARIVNLSLGDDEDYNSVGFYRAIKQKAITNPGIYFVLAAGNSAQNLDSPFNIKAKIKGVRSLKKLPNVYLVASTNKDGVLSKSSSYGKKSVRVATQGEKVKVINLTGEVDTVDGTSLATPNLGLFISHILSRNPKLTPQEVRKIIYDKTTQHPSLVGKVESAGYISPEQIIGY